jgi:hypothetical protein
MAVRKDRSVPPGRCVFSMIPVYDPDYVPRKKKKPHPGFAS